MFFPKFPYTNFFERNEDWILRTIRELVNEMNNFTKFNTIKYADPINWSIATQYEANTIVMNANKAYLSTKPVPLGVNISNTDYWVCILDLDALFSEIGDLSTLKTSIKDTLVNAINETYDLAYLASNSLLNLSGFNFSENDDISDFINTYATENVIFELDKNYSISKVTNKPVRILGNNHTLLFTGNTWMFNNDASHPYDLWFNNVTFDFNAKDFNGSFIETNNSNVYARNCTFTNTGSGASTACIGSGGAGSGIYIECAFTSVRQGIYDLGKNFSLIYKCSFDTINIGILLTTAENTRITRCTFANIAEIGILMGSTSYSAYSSNIDIEDCIFTNQTSSTPAYNKPITYANQLPNASGSFRVRNCTFTNCTGAVSIQGSGAHYDYRVYAKVEHITVTNCTSTLLYLHNADLEVNDCKCEQDTSTGYCIRLRFAKLDINGLDWNNTGNNFNSFIEIDSSDHTSIVNMKNVDLHNATFTNFLVSGQPTGTIKVIFDNKPNNFTVASGLLSQSEIFRKIFLRVYPSGLSSPDTRAYPDIDESIAVPFISTTGDIMAFDGTNLKTFTTT